jgi:DNA repair protein RadD
MSPVLRPYQVDAVDRLRDAIRRGLRAPLLVSPTGSGKTRMFAWLVSRLQQSGKRVAVLAHREELTTQISGALADAGAMHGLIVAGGSYYDPRVTAHVASVFTLKPRIERVAVPDYVIIDEAHHCILDSTWGRIIAYWREQNPRLIVIGVTATPERLSGEGLGEVFDGMVMGPTTAELIADGWLSPYAMFSPPGVDMSGVTKRGGDYAKGEANARVDKPRITGSAVDHYRQHLNGAPAVAFCASIEHAMHVAESFQAQGYRAAAIDGKMEKTTRRDIIRDFGAGKLNVLTSCDLISEGFDVPGIVGAILLRPTQSLALYLQQVGRALRPVYGPGDMDTREGRLRAIRMGPKPRAVIIDHVGNSGRIEDGAFLVNHGMPDDDREWSLAGAKDRKAKAARDPDAMPVKQCPKCYAINKAIAAGCRECGHVFVVKARTVREVEGELQQVDLDALRREARIAQGSAKDIDALKALGHSEARAAHILAARAEKDALRAVAMQAVEDAHRAIGSQRMPEKLIRALKPKQLQELIAASYGEIHAYALKLNRHREAA